MQFRKSGTPGGCFPTRRGRSPPASHRSWSIAVLRPGGTGIRRLRGRSKSSPLRQARRNQGFCQDSGSKRIASSVTRRGSTYAVPALGVDGANQARLTNDPDTDLSPNWSPDRTRIVCWSNRDGGDEIYVMNADGSDQTRLTSSPGSRSLLAPDGSKTSFISRRDGNLEIYVMDADGSDQTNMKNEPEPGRTPRPSRRSG